MWIYHIWRGTLSDDLSGSKVPRSRGSPVLLQRGEKWRNKCGLLVINQGSSALHSVPTLPPGMCPGPCQGGSLRTACSDLLGYRASLTPSHMHEAGANTSLLAEIPWLNPQFWGWQCRHGKREARSPHAWGNPWIQLRDNGILVVYNVMLSAKRYRKP